MAKNKFHFSTTFPPPVIHYGTMRKGVERTMEAENE